MRHSSVSSTVKLFKIELCRGRKGLEAIAHADSTQAALRLVQSKYTGWRIDTVIEIPGSAYFITAELEPERAAEQTPQRRSPKHHFSR